MGRPLKEVKPDDYRSIWAINLRELRSRKYSQQEQFADALTRNGLKTNKSTVSNWETGRFLPPIDSLPAIADTLGVPIAWLMPPHDNAPRHR